MHSRTVCVSRLLALMACVPLWALDGDAFTAKYCRACHNATVKSGGFSLERASAQHPEKAPDIWEKVVRKVSAGEMPPPKLPRADAAAAREFTSRILSDLDRFAQKSPYAGRAPIRRLNRTEYENAISDLLAVQLPVAAELPKDGVAAGFDNIADALSMSPLLLERYLKVARKVSELAVGTRDPSPVIEVYPATGTQAAWQGEGMPFGTRGGIRVNHYFSHDGDYQIRAFLDKQSLTPTEGVRFFRTTVRLKAGSHSVIVTFPDEFAAREGPVSDVSGPGGAALGGPLDLLGTAVRPTIEFRIDGKRVKLFEVAGMTAGEAAFDGQPGPPTLGRIEIAGPYNPAGVSETPSRKRIFTCRPGTTSEESACAARILSAVIRRAFRRDVSASDLKPFLATFGSARQKHGFDQAIGAAIRDVLIAPDFLFRLEFDAPGATPGSAHDVSEFELASRLSFFLWNTIPDDTLLDLASAGMLRKNMDREVRRMLDHPRSRTLATNFGEQWLGLRALRDVKPDAQAYPEYNQALAADFETETRLFVSNLVRENRSVLDLLRADYTYLNEPLARHYGVEGVVGSGFRRVHLTPAMQRAGVLTHGSVLMMSSHTTRTSPVLRGAWILSTLLNSPPPPPPANVPPLDEKPAEGQKLTIRQKVEQHRNNPACASCHSRIDPLGFALENFDVIGRWRESDGGGPVDSSGVLPSGESFKGPQGLRTVLLARQEEFLRGSVERLLTYALGRELDARDQPTVRAVIRSTADEYRFHDLVVAVVRSVPFQMRQVQE